MSLKTRHENTAVELDAELLRLIGATHALNLIVEGMSPSDGYLHMALEEVGDQIDRRAQNLLDLWERHSTKTDDALRELDA